MNNIQKHKLIHGWNPDLPDHRDFLYEAPSLILKILPPLIDLRAQCPPVFDQGELGSCTANAIAAAVQFEQMKQKEKNSFIPSRLFIYYNERFIEHTVKYDSGGMLRDGIKTVSKQGVCSEKIWPYNISEFTKKPSAQCYKEALKNEVLSYHRIAQTSEQMKACLTEGYPFVFGFSVYESFESEEVATRGIMPIPAKNEKLLGGHAVIAVGYDNSKQSFIIRNSWGTKWGIKGYFYMPYSYITDSNKSDDFWTIRLVE
jgi:C1A family cysteine protease